MKEAAHILVLGASGSIGRAVMTAIAATPGLDAVAGLHRRAETSGASRSVRADATDAAQLSRALDGATHVINAAGGAPATLRATVTALCKAARTRPDLRLVHISSMAVYGAATGLVAEAAPLFAETAYAAAKIAGEAEVMTRTASGLPAVILRPGIVYGPGSAQWTGRFARLLHQRRLGDLGAAGDGFCNLIHERDVAAACIAACLTPEADGLAFNLASAAPPTWNEYLASFARALRATPVKRITARQLRVETGVLAPILAGLRAAAPRSLRRRIPDPITPSLLRAFAQRIRLDPARADTILRFPRTQDAVGIAELGRMLAEAA